MGVLHDQLLIFTDGIADTGQDTAPDPRAGKGVERELEMVHAGNAGRNGDEMPDNRQQAADKG